MDLCCISTTLFATVKTIFTNLDFNSTEVVCDSVWPGHEKNNMNTTERERERVELGFGKCMVYLFSFFFKKRCHLMVLPRLATVLVGKMRGMTRSCRVDAHHLPNRSQPCNVICYSLLFHMKWKCTSQISLLNPVGNSLDYRHATLSKFRNA